MENDTGVKLMTRDCKFRKIADMEILPSNIVRDLSFLVGEKNDPRDDVLTFSDVNDFYIDYWHSLPMNKKKKVAKSFMRIHSWIMKIGGKYRLAPKDIFKTTMKNVCPTCRGAGLFVHGKKEYETITCPICKGEGDKTVICNQCNGYGCKICKDGLIHLKNQLCETCSIDSPFGKLKGNGKIMMEKIETTDTVVCLKCGGMGVQK